MAELQQVSDNSATNEEETSPETEETSRSRRRFKASNMSFAEMAEMVDILLKSDYDAKHGPYSKPNRRKAKILTKVVKSLKTNFGVKRSNEQLRKRWSDLKLREPEQLRSIKRMLAKRERRLGGGHSREHKNPTASQQPQTPKDPQTKDVEEVEVEEGEVQEGEVDDVVELVTTTGDVNVGVKDSTGFSADSALRLIQQVMECSTELDKIKERIHVMDQTFKDILDVLGRIQ